MKGAFILQRRFAYVGNELAMLLKERHGVSSFCAYVFTRESYDFLKSQQGLYSSLLLDEEVHAEYANEKIDWEFLKHLEKEYGLPTLWPYIENDRVVRYGQLVREYPYNTPPYTHEEMLRIVQVTAKRLIEFFERERPDFLAFYSLGAIGSLLAYHIARKKKTRILSILPARIGAKHLVTGHYSLFTGTHTAKGLTEAHREQARAFLESFRTAPAPYTDIDTMRVRGPSRSRHFAFLLPARIFSTVMWQIALWKNYFALEYKDDYTCIKPWYLIIDRIRRKLRILYGFNDLYDVPVAGEKYAFFPLQLEPEMTTLLYAPWFSDQLWVIKQLAKSLPVGYKLYVKEHLAMFGYRPRRFYKEVKKIPNVRLISPTMTSYPLITASELVATVTSTVGWEAIALKKPVVTFGEVFYNELPFVQVCKTPEELPHIVEKQLTSFSHDEKALVEFIAKLCRDSVDVDLVDIWEKERGSRTHERRDELAPFADLMFRTASSPGAEN